MRTLRDFCLLMLAVICLSSCDLFQRDYSPEVDIYMIALCFQDASGNNVSENMEAEEPGLETSMKNTNGEFVNPDSYSLNIVPQNYINGETVSGPDDYPALYSSSLGLFKHDRLGTCLTNYFSRFKENNNVRKLTYQLQCPSIFGDRETHELVTYWELTENIYAKCYRMEFEGQEIIPQIIQNQYYSLGVIRLDYVHKK